MFPRIAKSEKKSGTYEYLVISESIHVKGKGSTTRNIANLGNIKKFDSKKIESLIDGLIRLFQVEKYSLSDQVEILECLEHGSIIFWQKIWNKIGLSQEIKKLLRGDKSRLKIEVWKYVEMMVVNRCVDPLSKLGATRWIERTCYKAMKGYFDLNLDVEYFYRSMDHLLSIKDELESVLFEKMKTLFSINVALTFYDITSAFFHTDNCPIGRKGYSRDKRPDKEQIVIGVVTSYEGFPIKHYVFEGNTKDDTTIIEVIQELKKEYNIEETTFVGDRGMITRLNLSTIEKEGFDYIMGVKIRQSEIHGMLFEDDNGLDESKYKEYKGLKIQERYISIKDFLSWKIRQILLRNGVKVSEKKYKRVVDYVFSLKNGDEIKSLSVKEALVSITNDSKIRGQIISKLKKYKGQYENKLRTIVCLNEERRILLKNKRELKISSFSEVLSELFSNTGQNDEAVAIERKLEKVFSGYNRRYRKFFKVIRDGEQKAVGYALDERNILRDDNISGVFMLTTSRHDLKAGEIVDSYKSLKEVEMLFDDLKHFVDIMPFRHWLEIRVRAHVFLCILSLLLKRILEINYIKGKETMYPLEEISKSKLVRYEVKFSEKEDRKQKFPKITQTTPIQKEIFNLIGIRNPMCLENFVW